MATRGFFLLSLDAIFLCYAVPEQFVHLWCDLHFQIFSWYYRIFVFASKICLDCRFPARAKAASIGCWQGATLCDLINRIADPSHSWSTVVILAFQLNVLRSEQIPSHPPTSSLSSEPLCDASTDSRVVDTVLHTGCFDSRIKWL